MSGMKILVKNSLLIIIFILSLNFTNALIIPDQSSVTVTYPQSVYVSYTIYTAYQPATYSVDAYFAGGGLAANLASGSTTSTAFSSSVTTPGNPGNYIVRISYVDSIGLTDSADVPVTINGECNSGDSQSQQCGTSNVGACVFGSETRLCSGGIWEAYGSCVGAINPVTETCNNIDDDCNGAVDNGLTITCTGSAQCDDGNSLTSDTCNSPGTCFSSCSHTALTCTPGTTSNQTCGTSNTGACVLGTQTRTCDAFGNWGAYSSCIGAINPVTETCNNIDDDCNGITDNGLTITCTINSNCNDGLVHTTDTCNSGGSCFSSCSYSFTNNAPTINTGNQNVNEGTLLTFVVSATDSDGDTLTYSASGLPAGATFTQATATFSWTPTYSQNGSYSVTLSVNDGYTTVNKIITIIVNNVNQAPVLTNPGNQSVNENTLLTFTLSASDPDGDILSYTATGLPVGATLNAVTGTFTWTPTYTQAGIYTTTFTASDGTLTSSQTITITVNNINRPPTLNLISNQSVNENQTLTFTISGSDPDSDPISFSAIGAPGGSTLNTISGLFNWTPNFTQSGTHPITFTVTDGSLSASQTITITVNNVNRAPVINSVLFNLSILKTQEEIIIVNASDPDGDSINFSINDSRFSQNNNTFNWTTGLTDVGVYNVLITVTDSFGASISSTITFSVLNSNSAPVINFFTPSVNITINETDSILLNFTATDIDSNIDKYVITINGTAQNTTLIGQSYNFTTNYSYAGNYTVTFFVNDTVGLSDIKTIVIQVLNVNRAPVISSVNQNLVENQTLIYTPPASDPDGDTIAFSESGLPVAAIFNTGTGLINWTTISGDAGNYSITITASDGSLSANTNFVITITSIPINATSNSTIINSTTTNSTITNSTVINSTVINSTVTGSNVTASNITNSTITNSTVTNSNITLSNVTNSTITNSTVINSTVTGSNITNSTVTNSTVVNSNVTNSNVTNSTLTNSTISNSSIINSNVTTSSVTNSTVVNSTVINSSITNSNATNSTIINSTLTNSTVTNSNITSSNITNSTISNSNITNSNVTTSTITNSTLVNSSVINSTIINAGCQIINSTLSNVSINVSGICFIKNEFHANEIIIGVNFNSTLGDPLNNNITSLNFTSINSTYDFDNIFGNYANFIRSTVNYSNISDTNITDATVLNSALSNCLIQNSSFDNSNGVYCYIYDSNVSQNSNIINSTITASNITNSQVLGSNIINSGVLNSNLSNSNITNSAIINSSLANSQVSNSSITLSNITNSSVSGSNVNQSLVIGSNVTNSNLTNAIILSSNVTSSQILNSSLTNSTSISSSITNSSVNQGVITNSSVTSSVVNNSNLINSNFTLSTVINSTSSSSTINNSNITNSNINLSTIINSTIALSNITSSNVTNSTITNSVAAGSSITNSNISLSNITNSTVTNSAITNSNISLSNISNSTVLNSQAIGSSITASNITNSTVVNSTVSNLNLINTTVSNSTLVNLTITTIINGNVTNNVIQNGSTIIYFNGNIVVLTSNLNVSQLLNNAPTAAFLMPSSANVNTVVSFTDTSTDPDTLTLNDTLTYSWNFGNSITSTLKNPTNTYSSTGTFAVTLTVTDSFGLSNSLSQNILITTVITPSGGGGGGGSSRGSNITQTTESIIIELDCIPDLESCAEWEPCPINGIQTKQCNSETCNATVSRTCTYEPIQNITESPKNISANITAPAKKTEVKPSEKANLNESRMNLLTGKIIDSVLNVSTKQKLVGAAILLVLIALLTLSYFKVWKKESGKTLKRYRISDKRK